MATRKSRVKYPPPDVSVPGNVRIVVHYAETEVEHQAWLRGMERILEFGRKARLEEEAKAAASVDSEASEAASTPTAEDAVTHGGPTTLRRRTPKAPALIDSALSALLSMRLKMTLKEIRVALDVSRDEAKEAVDRLVNLGRVAVVRRGVNGSFKWLPAPDPPPQA